MSALDDLIAAVEAGDHDYLNCDSWIDAWDIAAPQLQTYRMKSDGISASVIAATAYHGSLDAAKALHEALLPGIIVNVWGPLKDGDWGANIINEDTIFAGNPARAWLLSILRAYRSLQEKPE